MASVQKTKGKEMRALRLWGALLRKEGLDIPVIGYTPNQVAESLKKLGETVPDMKRIYKIIVMDGWEVPDGCQLDFRWQRKKRRATK